MRKALTLTFALAFAASAVAQDDRLRIAIMDLQGSGVDQLTANNVSDLLRTELFNTGLFRVVERDQMKAIMSEQSLQLSGCTDTECAVQLGKMLAVRKMLVGTVMKMGTAYIINARIVDVEKAEMEFGDKARAESEADLERAVSEFARKLSVRIQGSTSSAGSAAKPAEPSIAPPAPPRPAGVRPYRTVGLVCIGVGVAVLGAGGYFEYASGVAQDDAIAYRDEYYDARDEESAVDLWGQHTDAVDTANQSATLGVISLATGGALVVGGVVAVLVRRSPAENLSAAVVPEYRGAALRLAMRF